MTGYLRRTRTISTKDLNDWISEEKEEYTDPCKDPVTGYLRRKRSISW
jgi:hypothetical protein